MATKNCICKCEGCGELFKPNKADRLKYCSRECAFKNKNKTHKVYIEKLGLLRISNAKHKNIKSFKVLIEVAALIRIKKNNKKQYKLNKKILKICKFCNNNFIYKIKNGRHAVFCSKKCLSSFSKSDEKTKELKRIAKSKRRAIERGLKADKIDPFVIFNLYKWKCHICGCKTPKEKRGSYDNNAPELDHIVSLADGGTHTFNNVACSCRSCNGKKSSKSFGQLKFF